MNLFDYKFYENKHPYLVDVIANPKSDEIFHMQYNLPLMRTGDVRTIWSSLYVVEKGLIDNSDPLKVLNWITKGLGFSFSHIIEGNDTPDRPFYQMMESMEKMELQVSKAKDYGFNVAVAKNFNEYQQYTANGTSCVIHSLEGAHMLGRNLPDPQTYVQRIKTLAQLGVCSITLSHFMPNSICFPVNGISPNTKNNLGFEFDYGRFIDKGLTPAGKSVVESMLQEGIIVDLNHISPAGRNDVYDINDKYKRPLVFSHIGIRRNLPNEFIAPEDWEIKRIRDCGGAIGVIFMNYWLNGTEDPDNDDGIQNVIKTIRDIAKVCGETEDDDETKMNYNHICLGSDMDGFTQPIDDLYDSSLMQDLTKAMSKAGISDENIAKVFYFNAERVMKLGWGKQ